MVWPPLIGRRCCDEGCGGNAANLVGTDINFNVVDQTLYQLNIGVDERNLADGALSLGTWRGMAHFGS